MVTDKIEVVLKPESQSLHVAKDPLEYVPLGHVVHTVEPACAAVPGLQSVHVVMLLVSANCPIPQEKHADIPPTPENVPG